MNTDITLTYVALASVAVSLVALVRCAGVDVAGAVGHSLGDSFCGYALGNNAYCKVCNRNYFGLDITVVML